jgi:hypothetical protein
MFKLNLYDTHDRLKAFTTKGFYIAECCQSLIDQKPFGNHPFYIFCHARKDDDGINTRLIWQPRLSKPKSQSNSMLFKAYPGTDNVDVIWMIPARELWNQYEKGNVTESQIVVESIHKFIHNRKELDAKEEKDLNDDEIRKIYREISQKKKYKMV